MSTSRYTNGLRKYPHRTGRGPNGRPLCRVCGQEVAKGRRTFCAQACANRYLLETDGAALRRLVFERDKGVCSICELDCDALYREHKAALKSIKARYDARVWRDGILAKLRDDWTNSESQKQYRELMLDLSREENAARTAYTHELREQGWNVWNAYWNADHIVPVCEGGGECGLDNLRTLCVKCHKKETAKLAAKRAASREEEFTQQVLNGRYGTHWGAGPTPVTTTTEPNNGFHSPASAD